MEIPDVYKRQGDYRAVLALGNRCGFTDGYYHRHNGSDMVTFTKPNYEKTNEALQKQILRTYEDVYKRQVRM